MADKCFFVDLPEAEKARARTMFLGARNYDGYLYELGTHGKVLSRKWFCVPDSERVQAPKHGDQRNWRIEEANEQRQRLTLHSGEAMIIEYPGDTQSVSERFCASCHDWVTSAGVLGGVLCPHCHTPWL